MWFEKHLKKCQKSSGDGVPDAAKPIWPPQEIGTTDIGFLSGDSTWQSNGVKLFDVGNSIITKDFISNYIEETRISNHKKLNRNVVSGNYHTPKDGDNIVEHSINYEWKSGGRSDYGETLKVSAFLLNKKLVVLLHNKSYDSSSLTRFSVIEYNGNDVVNAIVEGTDDKEQNIVYVEL